MTVTVSDYLLKFPGIPAQYVQAINNGTSTAYVSVAPSDGNGLFTIVAPAGNYTLSVGPTATGPWTATGDTNYVIADPAGGASDPLKANVASPTFTGTVTTPSLTVSGTVSLPAASIPESATANLSADLAARALLTDLDALRVTLIPSIWLWLKAGSLNLADGAKVQTWPDSGPNGFSPTQAASANQPVFKPNILNGNPVIRYDALSILACAFPSLPNGNTVFVVLDQGRPWENAPGTGGRQILGQDSTTFCMFAGGSIIDSTTLVVPGTFRVLSAILNTTSSRLRVNGGGDDRTGNPGNSPMGQFSNGGGWAGDMAEVIAYSTILTISQIRIIEAYLGRKYGITVTP